MMFKKSNDTLELDGFQVKTIYGDGDLNGLPKSQCSHFSRRLNVSRFGIFYVPEYSSLPEY